MEMANVPKDIIYKSISQVFRTLNHYKDVPEVRSIVKLCYELGIHQKQTSNDTEPEPTSVEHDQTLQNISPVGKHPFVVIEGLDGTGKTTLARYLSETLQMKFMATPPKNYDKFDVFIKLRDFFDEQEEPFRRAYYSLGNYLAANEVIKASQPVVMDRFWHSTAAYSLAHQQKYGLENFYNKSDLLWPSDLLVPDLVIFLQVSENERLRRHSSRKAFTNTPEEQILADDPIFRQNLFQHYRSVVGPPFQELIIDGQQPDSEKKILNAVLNAFPPLEENLHEKRAI